MDKSTDAPFWLTALLESLISWDFKSHDKNYLQNSLEKFIKLNFITWKLDEIIVKTFIKRIIKYYWIWDENIVKIEAKGTEYVMNICCENIVKL